MARLTLTDDDYIARCGGENKHLLLRCSRCWLQRSLTNNIVLALDLRMFKLLLDTSVWLDVAKDERQTPLLEVIEEMVSQKFVSLVVSRIVVDEFQRNRERIAKESAKSLSSHFKLVREAVGSSQREHQVGGMTRHA